MGSFERLDAQLQIKADLLDLGLRALDGDDAARVVFSDAVLVGGWFDVRVMPVCWQPARVPRYGLNRAQRDARRHAIERQEAVLHTRSAFEADAARASLRWVRACVAVLLFGDWRKGRWPLINAMHKKRREEEREARVHARAEVWRRLERQSDPCPGVYVNIQFAEGSVVS